MPLPKNIKDLTDNIEVSVESYSSGLEPFQKEIYRKVLALLKDLSTDADGNIKTTVENYKIIARVKTAMKNVLESNKYLKHVEKVDKHYKEVKEIQTNYFISMFTDFSTPAVIAEIQKQAINDTIESLTESGINEILVNKATDIVSDNIKSGRNFSDMTNEIENFILGNDEVYGKLVSYSKQIINDSLSQYAGHFNKIITDDLDLEWFGYVGGLVRDSRPLCKELIHHKQYIHKSELKKIAEGIIDGRTEDEKKNGYKNGMIPGTNENNFMEYRGGFNCGHILQPISAEFVPENIRNKFKEEDTNEE